MPAIAETEPKPRALPRVRRRTVALNWAGIAVLAIAPAVDTPWFRWIAVGVLGVQALGNWSIRSLYMRNARGLPDLASPLPADEPLPGISVIVPARNEADSIEAGLRSLLAQNYPRLEVVAINDGSTDETPAILDQIASEDPRVRVIHDPPLPEGWQGKANAIWQGVHASDAEYPWLLLTDADAIFGPDALRNAIAIAEKETLDFLTGIFYVDNGSVWEELILPVAWAGLVINARPGHLMDPAATPIGIGPFILVKRSTYLASGGHARIRNLQPEDTYLAAVVKASGATVGVAMANRTVHVRIYRGLAAMVKALVRKMRIQYRQQPAFLEMRITYALLQEVLPFPLLLASFFAVAYGAAGAFSWIVFGMAALAAYVSCALAIREFRSVAKMRPLLEWFHPAAGVLRTGFAILAWQQEWFQFPLTWRDRVISEVATAKPEPDDRRSS